MLLELDVEFDVPPVEAPYPRPSIIFPNNRQNAGSAAPNAVAAVVPIINNV